MEKAEKNCFQVNDIVTYNSESWVVVYMEDDFLWIRNVMFHSGAEKVHANDVMLGGGYGDTATDEEKSPKRSEVISDKTLNFSLGDEPQVRAITDKIEGKTIREIRNLGIPLA